MTTTLQWKKGIFKCAYRIFNAGQKVGKLIENPWTQSARGEMNGTRLLFKVKNAWIPRAEIIDTSGRKITGKIQFSCWWPKATIEHGGQRFTWYYTNWWGTKWRIAGEEGNQVVYCGHVNRGEITGKIANEALLLTGLFIGNYYWQMLQIYVIAIIFPMLFLVN